MRIPLVEPATYRTAEWPFTTVPLHLDPNDAVFVRLPQPATATSRTLPKPVETKLAG